MLYELSLERNLGKKNPLNESDLDEFKETFENRKASDNSWIISLDEINQKSWEISLNNPNKEIILDSRGAEEIIENIKIIDKQISTSIKTIGDI